jgi:predicted DNA-binding transcriptional regulator YafY
MARPSAADRARRLLALLPYLGRQRTIPLQELATATGTDVATLAADLTLLSMCGSDDWNLVGVLVEGDVAEVFSALPALERPVRLTPPEARALATALEAIGIEPASDLPRRLSDVAGHGPDLEELGRCVRSSLAPGGQAAVIAALTYAAGARTAARIRYFSTERGGDSVRAVRPYALYAWRGAWYLLAYCEAAGEERTFRVDRITAVEQTHVPFERPEGLPATLAPLPDFASLPRATVRFLADAPDLNDRDWPGATFAPQEDGSVVASVPYAGCAWIASKVAARLGEAEVAGPDEVRSAVASRAARLLETLAATDS